MYDKTEKKMRSHTSNSKQVNTFLHGATRMAERAGKRLSHYFRKEEPIARGTVKEVKTVYDEIADKVIKDAIEQNFPSHSYLTEETGLVEKEKEYLWIVDPLDGTSNFANHNPMFAVSIALWYKGEPILGVIEAPMLQERFVAVAHKGAYHYDLLRRRKSQAHISFIDQLDRAYVVYCEGGEKDKKRLVHLWSKLYLQVKDTRKLGSAALELAWVGMGRSDGYVTTQISLWDIAAGILFVKEAGGEVLHLDAYPYRWSEFEARKKFDLLATNGKILLSF
jgi:myo-inositol-1(or 4)-monophosphatase